MFFNSVKSFRMLITGNTTLPVPDTLVSEDVGTENLSQRTLQHAEGMDTSSSEDASCPVCRTDVTADQDGILCEMCKMWSHKSCLFMNDVEYQTLVESSEPWYCSTCLAIRANKIKWGEVEGEIAIRKVITSVYEEMITWRKNLFMLPRGKAGTDFIRELARLIRLFTVPSKWYRLALAKVHIFIPLMLQKPSAKSKAKDHAKYLEKRLKLWSAGNLDALMSENREIQKKLVRNQEKKDESKYKNFNKFMLLGKISQAMKFINNEDSTRGVHTLTDEIKQILEEKHPKARDISEDILIPPTADEPEPVIFEAIDGTSVYKAAKQLQGSGGPSLMDADGWKHILCSKSYGSASSDLCEAIADLAKKLCSG